MTEITGQTLLQWGYKPGAYFKQAISDANGLAAMGRSEAYIRAHIDELLPPPVIPLRPSGALPYHLNIRAENEIEAANVAAVEQTMVELMRVPTVVAGAVMPDACPAGEICVGGVVATKEAIHPGYHSADICCSMSISILGNVDPAVVMDVAMKSVHFGYGGRPDVIEPDGALMDDFEHNSFLKQFMPLAIRDHGSSGDGNHHVFVGHMKSTGEVAMVTHWGSRGPGAALYKAGMRTAEGFRSRLSPETPKGSAWIPSETAEGEAYWRALGLIEEWTGSSHRAVHSLIAERLGVRIKDQWFNPHNFIFRRSDGLFYHAKGATPGWSDYDLTLVPLNMAEPVLITRGRDAANGLGFLPHGAGRNMSRTRYLRDNLEHPFPPGIDVRFFSGTPDHSELPGAYKNAATVRAQIDEFGLADVVDEVLPYGTIMAGELEKFWLKPKVSA
jgi:RNA-splicing ligase RtcB